MRMRENEKDRARKRAPMKQNKNERMKTRMTIKWKIE